MNSQTRVQIQEIKKKVTNPATGTPIFADENAVVTLAVEQLYKQLKQKRVL